MRNKTTGTTRNQTEQSLLNIIGALATTIGMTIVLLVGGYILITAIGRAWDEGIDNQSRMLCRTARETGNEYYLNKCQRYYSTGDLRYMR